MFQADPNLINKQLADASHQGTSFDPEIRSKQEIECFATEVNNMYEELSKIAKSESQQTFLIEEMNRFQLGYAEKYNNYLSAKGRCFSVLITGGSGFNNYRHDKANRTEDKRYQDRKEFKHKAFMAINHKLKEMAIQEAGGELVVLQKKIESAERNHVFMVETNKIVRKKISDDEKVTEIMVLMPISEKTARELLKPDYCNNIGFPAYSLSNDTANIHRMKERLAELQKKEATPTSEITVTAPDTEGVGFKIIDNAEADRVQIVFDSIPDETIRTKLKSEGWRWSQHNSAWQRKRTQAAMQSAKRIMVVV